jgi:salicylate hydroxylase
MAGAAALARNTTMRLAPPARVMAGFDWLYGWRL